MAANDVGALGLQKPNVHCVEDIPCLLQDAGALAEDYQYF
jgi:hypothetical protein